MEGSITRPMVNHIETYSSEKLFGENAIVFLNATGKQISGASITLYIARKFEKLSKFSIFLSVACR